MKRAILALVAMMVIAAPRILHAQDRGVSLPAAKAPGQDWRRVLIIGAHPDDEDSQLISWLERADQAETAYLSLTRGDGGQNLIGNELGEALGVIRTEELLAARRVDGAHQFFTRAYDFGFSKSATETYNHWPKDSLLNDVVKVVRAFRPQIIIAIFSGTPRDGHGQHQVSAMLAKEAYEAAGDASRFHPSLGEPWTPQKFYRAVWYAPMTATLKINVGEFNPVLGKSYAEIAGESRSQHRSQGFGALQRKGVVWDYVMREATRVNESTPANKEESIFDGITALPPTSGTQSAAQALARKAVALEAVSDRQYVAVGDSARVIATFYNRGRNAVALTQRFGDSSGVVKILGDSVYRWVYYVRGNEITQPWWLATPRNGDLFSRPIPVSRGAGTEPAETAEDQRNRSNEANATVMIPGDSEPLRVSAPIVFRYVDPIRGDVQKPLATAPAISVSLENRSELARANSPLERYFNVTLRSASLKAAPVTVTLKLPPGLTADSVSRSITLDSARTRTMTFKVHGRLSPGVHQLGVVASSGGNTYEAGYVPIDYEHISPERLYRPAQVAIHAVDIAIPARLNVGYVRGVGDNVEPALAQLGIPVTEIEPKAIPTVDLSKFSTVVVGPRAYQASRELVDNNPYLLNFAKDGGTLVVQYGQYEMTRPGMMPYAISIAQPHDRVTEETAPITIIDASSVALHRPNRISADDFNGWVQERALYMPRTFDDRYHPIVALNDPGEPVNRGGIMVAPYGKGLYIYTTLAFFRQLPAGVSGASKLFVNLLSMSNDGMTRAAMGAGK